MDLTNTGLLISGLIVGAIGMGIFLYGKKQGNFKCIAVGLGMSIFPYFAPTVLMTWLIAGACLAGLYLLPSGE